MTKLNHLGEPDNSKELPITAHHLERACLDKVREGRANSYQLGLDYKEVLHEHMLKLCDDFSNALDLIHEQTMLSLGSVIDLTPRQDVRVREALLNAIQVTADTSVSYADLTEEYAARGSEREDALYGAVHDFEDRVRDQVNSLWEKVNN